jgi:hypothetical protein
MCYVDKPAPATAVLLVVVFLPRLPPPHPPPHAPPSGPMMRSSCSSGSSHSSCPLLACPNASIHASSLARYSCWFIFSGRRRPSRRRRPCQKTDARVCSQMPFQAREPSPITVRRCCCDCCCCCSFCCCPSCCPCCCCASSPSSRRRRAELAPFVASAGTLAQWPGASGVHLAVAISCGCVGV